MLASRLLAPRRQPHPGEAASSGRTAGSPVAGNSAFSSLENAYLDLLRWVLDHRLVTVFGVSRLARCQPVCCLPRIGSEFLPPSDEGEVRVTGKMEIGTRLDLVDRQTRIMEQHRSRLPCPRRSASVASVGAERLAGGCGFRG